MKRFQRKLACQFEQRIGQHRFQGESGCGRDPPIESQRGFIQRKDYGLHGDLLIKNIVQLILCGGLTIVIEYYHWNNAERMSERWQRKKW